MVAISFLLLASLIALALAYQGVGSLLDARSFPPPGRMVSVGACRLHLDQQGAGGPVVLLEAGIAATSLGWSLVQPGMAEFTTACSYDRAGLGWSYPSALPRSLDNMLTELAGLLETAHLPPPYILVGHSFGGLLVRAYASLHPEQIAGLVLVDPVSLAAWAPCQGTQRTRLSRAVRLSRRGALLARFGIVRAALTMLVSGGRFLPQLIGRTAAGRGSPVMTRLVAEVRKLPREVWPSIQSHWSNPKSFSAMAAYLEWLPACAEHALGMTIPPDIPLTILSAGNANPAELNERDQWAQQSLQGRHIIVNDAGHWIQLEHPNVVIEAVREMVCQSRRPQ